MNEIKINVLFNEEGLELEKLIDKIFEDYIREKINLQICHQN